MVKKKSGRFRRAIIAWYRLHRRDLPWRHTRDPYRILVSEVMLQQTQVDRVLLAYRGFLRRFPTVKRLAAARQDDVVRAWSGLGYNRRAVFLHKAARRIVQDHSGRLPRSISGLETLPGVGPYTARAVATFAFQQRVAAIDTNHRRVVGRWFLGNRARQRDVAALADSLVPRTAPDLWNHALMDFGALVCRSRPRCGDCPIRSACRAYPAVLQQARPRTRKSEAFLGSNRYIRGRIIERLRAERRSGGLSLQALMPEFSSLPGVTAERVLLAVRALQREGFLSLHKRKGASRIVLLP